MARRKPLPQALEVAVRHSNHDQLGVGVVQQGEVEREVHLRNALPGEQVVARVLKRRRGLWYGNAMSVAQPNAQRRAVACDVFPRCGGCALQHVAQSAQLTAKQDQLAALLVEQGVKARQWRSPVTGPQFGYRRKARLGVRCVGEQVFVGFREAFASRVVDMTQCPTLDPRLSALIEPLRATIGRMRASRTIPQIEVAAGDNQCAVVIRHLEPLDAHDMDVLQQFASGVTAQVLTQSGGYETVMPLPGGVSTMLSYGLPEFGLNLSFDPTAFTQVNAHMNQLLVRHAVNALSPSRQVADLFCGIGNFSLALARRGKHVTGVEASAEAIERAQANAQRNGLQGRVRFSVGDLYSDAANADAVVPPGTDALLLDPPRSGAGAQLRGWLTAEIERVSYVSCNPATFAADARVLQDAGFSLQEVGVYDMFPQTTHVETLGVFLRS